MSLSFYPHKKVVPKDATIREICLKGRNLKSPYLISLYYAMYLTGARVSEILKVKAKDIEKVNTDKGKMVRVHLYTLKNRRNPERYVSIPYDNPATTWEKTMLEYLLTYKKNFQPQQRLWCMEGGNEKEEKKFIATARNEIWRRFNSRVEFEVECQEDRMIGEKEVLNEKTKEVEILPVFKTFSLLGTKKVRLYPHYLRVCRTSHWVRYYRMDAQALKYALGHSSIDQAESYIRDSPETQERCMVPK